MRAMKSFVIKHSVVAYFVMTFTISWGGVLLAISGAAGMTGVNAQDSPQFPLVLLAMVAGPAVAGLALTGFIDGRPGLHELRSRMLKWRVRAHFYGVTFAAGIWLVLAGAMASRGNWRSVRANRAERNRRLAGDEFISDPIGILTHAITIGRAPQVVWPWLVQMGAGRRAGWYSYDILDNGQHPSATQVVPELQHITIGTLFPALPDATDGFTVLDFAPCRSLILGWPGVDGAPLVTWAFVLEESTGTTTRLIVRARGARGYSFRGLPSWMSIPIVRLVHFVMQRKQLLNIARRVECRSPEFRSSVSTAQLSHV